MKLHAALAAALLLFALPAYADDTIILSGDTISAGEDAGVEIEGSVATITEEGTYTITGSLNEGRIVVDARSDDVVLLLSGTQIHCSEGAPLYITDAGSVTLRTVADTENILSDGKYRRHGSNDDLEAVIYSKDRLTLEGEGSLKIQAYCKDGINCRDKLVMNSGTVSISAAGNGLKAKNEVSITGGELMISAQKDGIKATNDKTSGLGSVNIEGGKTSIVCDENGIRAVSLVQISGGDVFIETMNNAVKSKKLLYITGGTVEIITDDDGLKADEPVISDKAIVTVNGLRVFE